MTLMLHIEKDGRVSTVAVVSGNSLLSTQAILAAKRLRFKPYYQNDEAVRPKGKSFNCTLLFPRRARP